MGASSAVWANGPNLVDPHTVPGYIGAIVFGLVLCLSGLAALFDYRGFIRSLQEDRRWPITLPGWCFRTMGAGIVAAGLYIGANGIVLLI
jgi:hypothetical protein